MKKLCAVTLCSTVLLTGCAEREVPQGTFAHNEKTSSLRQMQSRAFDTRDEKKLLSASAAVLQDMGYSISESESKLGLIVAEKKRETENKSMRGLAHAAMVLNALNGQYDSRVYDNVDKEHVIRVSLVTKPLPKETNVRVTFQRKVWDMNGNLMRLESLQDSEIYRGFYSKLSKAVFLEAHEV